MAPFVFLVEVCVCRMRWIGVVLAVSLVSGCQALPPAPTPAPVSTPEAAETPGAISPLPSPTGASIDVSPLPPPSDAGAPTTEAQGIRFEIDRPVRAGDTVLRGAGVPGTGLAAHDVTRMGVELGAGIVGNNGRFEITVGQLTPSVRLGITLVEPDDTIWADPALLGPQSLVVPMVGSYLDTVMVEP